MATVDDTDIRNLAQRYNRIKSIHQQRDLLPQASFRDALSCIAQIFLRHQANNDFAITLLHRHHQLPPDHAMVHTRGLKDEDYCSMEQLGHREIFPYAYYCCHDEAANFRPYEFSSAPVPLPDKALLSEVATYLHQRDLSEAIAISHLAHPELIWMEKSSHNGRGTTAVALRKEQVSWDDTYIETEWAVIQDDTGTKIVAIRGCDDKQAGHKTI